MVGVATKRAARPVEFPIVFEDASILVIDKPSGVAVHGGSGVSHGIIESLRAARPQAKMLELAHRLDRISEKHRSSRDFTLGSLKTALREIIAAFPVYRTYVGERVGEVGRRHAELFESPPDVAARGSRHQDEQIRDSGLQRPQRLEQDVGTFLELGLEPFAPADAVLLK